jgi:hypothetical protein
LRPDGFVSAPAALRGLLADCGVAWLGLLNSCPSPCLARTRLRTVISTFPAGSVAIVPAGVGDHPGRSLSVTATVGETAISD